METWGLAGVGGGKDREKEKDTEEKQRTEEASFAPNDSFFCGAGRVGVQRGHHLTLEKFRELWRRAKRREAVEMGGAGQAQWRQVGKAGSSPPKPESMQTPCGWDKATGLVITKEERWGQRKEGARGGGHRCEAGRKSLVRGSGCPRWASVSGTGTWRATLAGGCVGRVFPAVFADS